MASRYRLFKSNIESWGSHYLILVALQIFALFIAFHPPLFDAATSLLFSLLVSVNHTMIYLSPLLLLNYVFNRFASFNRGKLLIPLLAATTLALLYGDAKLYLLFKFHYNGFVWNLLTTRGGIESLGASDSDFMVIGVGFLLLVTIQYVIYWAVEFRFGTRLRHLLQRWPINKKTAIATLVAFIVAEKLIFAHAKFVVNGNILAYADSVLMYKGASARKLFTRLGITAETTASVVAYDNTHNDILYPKNPIVLNEQADSPPDIIFLVAESLRYDMLTPERMPLLYSRAKACSVFRQHYSGGNGTRQGLFSLFSGLYGVMWDQFLAEQHKLVFFDVLDRLHYQYALYTSARFTYPEFDKVIFNHIPKQQLHEDDSSPVWQRDINNIDQLINNVSSPNRERPLFGFMFFESTHAAYHFPEYSALRKNYLKRFTYTSLSEEFLHQNIKRIFARYENSAHFVDTQIARILDAIKQNNRNSIIVITGDHGEEFLEKDHWGHNAGFSEEQVRVPMVICGVPSLQPGQYDYMTSHTDVVPELLKTLGVTNPVSDYAMGTPLSVPQRNYVVVSSWTDIGVIESEKKIVVPFKTRTQHRNLITNKNDKPIESQDAAYALKDAMLVIKQLKAFQQG